MMGGSFEVEENDFKQSSLNEDETGIVLDFYSGLKITIKNNDNNIEKWITIGDKD